MGVRKNSDCKKGESGIDLCKSTMAALVTSTHISPLISYSRAANVFLERSSLGWRHAVCVRGNATAGNHPPAEVAIRMQNPVSGIANRMINTSHGCIDRPF